jgi:hypothetical protein
MCTGRRRRPAVFKYAAFDLRTPLHTFHTVRELWNLSSQSAAHCETHFRREASVTAHETFVIFVVLRFAGILRINQTYRARMMNFLFRISSWIAPRWAMSAAIACALALSVLACIRCLETENTRAQRVHRKKEKELRALTQKILFYARGVHQRFPTGDVVGEKDLAEQLRKHPATVAVALNVLLGERKVQKAPLNGYWKLNVD